MKPHTDYRLCLVTDAELCRPRTVEEVVARAVEGGVTWVQLREKHADTRLFVERGRALHRLLAPRGIPLVINDRVDVALAVGAEGIHLGQSDMAVADARRILGPDAIIGLSIENLDQLREAESLDVDNYGVSPVFATQTKTDTAPAWGLDGLRRLRMATARPLIAIGGINLSNAADVVAAGATGLAVVSAICCAADPASAAGDLLAAFG